MTHVTGPTGQAGAAAASTIALARPQFARHKAVMAREIDPRRTRKALRAVRKLAEATPADAYSGWEQEFLSELGQRLETYGSAFHDGSKGSLDEALSTLQQVKLKEIAAKAKGKPRKPMGWRKQDARAKAKIGEEPEET